MEKLHIIMMDKYPSLMPRSPSGIFSGTHCSHCYVPLVNVEVHSPLLGFAPQKRLLRVRSKDHVLRMKTPFAEISGFEL